MSRRKKRTTAAAMAVATAALLTATGAPAASAHMRPAPSKHSTASHSDRFHTDKRQAQEDYVEAVTEARRVLAAARTEVTEQALLVRNLRASVESARTSWQEAVAAGDEEMAYEWSRDLAVRTERYEAARAQLREARRVFKHEAQRDYRAAVKAAQKDRDAAFRLAPR